MSTFYLVLIRHSTSPFMMQVRAVAIDADKLSLLLLDLETRVSICQIEIISVSFSLDGPSFVL